MSSFCKSSSSKASSSMSSSIHDDEIEMHNLRLLATLELGDVIEVKKELYSHWMVYKGKGRVVHRGTKSGTEDDFLEACGGYKAYKNNKHDHLKTPRSKRKKGEYAKSKIGDKGYNVETKTCEHFATESSDQIMSSFCKSSSSKASSSMSSSIHDDEIEMHNLRLLATQELGDVIEVRKEVYSHWMIYTGEGRVIHRGTKGVTEDDFIKACGVYKAYKNNKHDRLISNRKRIFGRINNT